MEHDEKVDLTRRSDLKIILNSGRLIKKVFFLGAGFSAYAGIPTFSNFRDRVQNIYDNLSDQDQNKMLLGRFLNIWRQQFNEYNIEEYYSIIEMYKSLQYENIVSTDDIMRVIRITIEKSLEKNDSIYQTYSNFLRCIHSQDAISMTTNWDILPEIIFDDFLKMGYVEYQGPEAYNKYDKGKDNANIYVILKLHGSLNWGFCKECRKIYYLTKDNYKDLTSEEGVKCKIHNIRLQNFIIPPTLMKSSQNIEDIWRTAFDYISGCEELYFIGYSFPETDIAMKILVSAALNRNSRIKKIYIISNMKHGNSKIDFEERYRLVIPKKIPDSKICFYFRGFKGLCNDLQKNLDNTKGPRWNNLITDTDFIC